MKKTPETFLHTLTKITLPSEARSSMRATLSEYADMHPVLPMAIPTPFAFNMLSFRWTAAIAVVLMVLLTGSGVTYAAEAAVPGDILYAVKRKVTEPVISSLAMNTEAKAKLHTDLAERRLEEATKLAAMDRLDEKTSMTLVAEFESSANDSAAYADQLESEGESDTALALRSDMEARLSAHAQILALVAEAPEKGRDEDRSVTAFAKRVAQRVSIASMVRADAETAVVASIDTPEESTTVATLASTESEPVIMMAKMSAEPEARSKVQEIVNEAKVLVADNEPAQAYIRTQEAVRAATQATIFEKNKTLLAKLHARIDGNQTLTASSTSATTTATTTLQMPVEVQPATLPFKK